MIDSRDPQEFGTALLETAKVVRQTNPKATLSEVADLIEDPSIIDFIKLSAGVNNGPNERTDNGASRATEETAPDKT